MTEPAEPESSGNTAGPFLGALAVIVAVVIAIWLIDVFASRGPTDDALIARAVSGQNDALQRSDYNAFRTFTCAEQLGQEAGQEADVLAGQHDSVSSRGERVVDSVGGVTVDGDRATATVTYYFKKDTGAKQTVPVRLARQDGTWKVCSTGPR